MNYKSKQFKNISEAVKEQLGIEEDDDPLEVAPALYVSEEISDLKNQLKKRDRYIHDLEDVVEDLNLRISHLEKMFFEFKSKKR